MARRRPDWCTNEDCVEDHVAHVRDGDTQLILVGGKRAYVWVGIDGDPRAIGSIDDRRAMRRFAKAVLAALAPGPDTTGEKR